LTVINGKPLIEADLPRVPDVTKNGSASYGKVGLGNQEISGWNGSSEYVESVCEMATAPQHLIMWTAEAFDRRLT
jgi:hypothetical protein